MTVPVASRSQSTLVWLASLVMISVPRYLRASAFCPSRTFCRTSLPPVSLPRWRRALGSSNRTDGRSPTNDFVEEASHREVDGVDPARNYRKGEVIRREVDDPAKYQKKYKIRGSTDGQSRVGVRLVTNTGHALQTDLPRLTGGRDQAAQPVETLLAALIGCTQATAMFVARNLRPSRLAIDRIDFDVEAVRDERGALSLPIDVTPDVPSRLRSVAGTVRVHAANNGEIDDSVLELLREQTEIRCPVANMMIASGCDLNVRWIDGSKA
jgi:uncharacterized OsmC-like protein